MSMLGLNGIGIRWKMTTDCAGRKKKITGFRPTAVSTRRCPTAVISAPSPYYWACTLL